MHTPATLPPGKSPGNHSTGSCVGPRAGLEGYGEAKIFCLPPGFKTWTVQPVVSCYTNYATQQFKSVFMQIQVQQEKQQYHALSTWLQVKTTQCSHVSEN